MNIPKEILAAARGGYYGSTDLEAIVYLLLNPNEHTIPNTMPRTKELEEIVNRMNHREASIDALLQVSKVDKDKWFNDSHHYGLSPVELVSIHELISISGRYNAEARVGFIIRGVESAYAGEGIIEKANRILDELAPDPNYYLGTLPPDINLRDLTSSGTYVATRGSGMPLTLKAGDAGTWEQLAEDLRKAKQEAENRPVVTAVQKSSDMSTVGILYDDISTETPMDPKQYVRPGFLPAPEGFIRYVTKKSSSDRVYEYLVEDKSGSGVDFFTEGAYWGSPTGSRFTAQLLRDLKALNDKLNDTEDQIREQEYREQEYQEYLSEGYVHISEDCVQDNWLSMEPYKRDFRRRIVAGSGKRKVCGSTHRRADKRCSAKAESFAERWLSDDIL